MPVMEATVAKSRKRSRSAVGSARWTPPPQTSLAPPADLFHGYRLAPVDYAAPWEGPPRNSASPLISTVLVVPQDPPRWGGSRESPRIRVYASHRSTGAARKASSPFGQVVDAPVQLSNRAIVCARRGVRREVLFAQRKTGRGARSPRQRAYNSYVRC